MYTLYTHVYLVFPVYLVYLVYPCILTYTLYTLYNHVYFVYPVYPVKPFFEALSLDFKNRGVKLSGIYIDNCCKWRHLLASYFPNVPVKLDFFHAIQRITKKVSKRSHVFAEVCKDYSLVFRDQRDQTIERKAPTPAPEEILGNLNNFITKLVQYKNSSDARVISKSVGKELKNIECHVRKRCLSHIPPG